MLSSTDLETSIMNFFIKELPEGYDEEKKILIRLLVPKVDTRKITKLYLKCCPIYQRTCKRNW